MGSNKKNEQFKSLKRKYQKPQKQLFTVSPLIICSVLGIPAKYGKNEKMKEKSSYDLWFSFPQATVWDGSEKLCP